MSAEKRKDIYFALYVISVIILAVIYFTVPEREAFIDFQIKWWSEFWNIAASLFN